MLAALVLLRVQHDDAGVLTLLRKILPAAPRLPVPAGQVSGAVFYSGRLERN